MVEIFAKEAPDRVYELERWGGLFDRTEDGRILQRPFGAHTYRRLCHVGDRTGLELIRTLQDKAVHSGIKVHMEVTFTRLLRDAERIAGAFGYRREDGRFVVFKAKAVILGTGGWGKVYKVTSNSWECTGDGCAMAFEAGAELMDMEMVQFHPTGMVWPPGVRGILVTEAVRGEGGILRNAKGERFMERYDPKKLDLSSRDVGSRAIYKEVQAGRGRWPPACMGRIAWAATRSPTSWSSASGPASTRRPTRRRSGPCPPLTAARRPRSARCSSDHSMRREGRIPSRCTRSCRTSWARTPGSRGPASNSPRGCKRSWRFKSGPSSCTPAARCSSIPGGTPAGTSGSC